MWEKRLINEPPYYVSRVLVADINQFKLLKSCLEGGLDLLELSPQFLKNTAYISRFVKNFRSQFRSFPILQYMRKIKLAIEKIHKNNAKASVESVLSGFPIHLGSGYDLELPTKQYFEYCLAKILAHCQIMVRLVICSKKCALYFVHFLQYGHFIEISTMMIALLGHVWHQARQCLLRMDTFYNQLHKFRELFPNQKAESKEYQFPTDLGAFIGEDWREEVDVLIEQSKVTTSSSSFNLLTQVGSQGHSSKEEQKDEPQLRPTSSISRKVAKNSILSQDDDMGEVISRDTLEVASPHIPEVLGKKTLIKFLKTETELRTKGSQKSLTKGISQFHWEKFRQLMEGKTKSGSSIKDVFDKEWTKLMSVNKK